MVAVTAALLAACAEEVTDPISTRGVPAAGIVAGQARPETLDELFARIATQSPTFGGMFIRDGQLVVKVTTPLDSLEVLDAIGVTGVLQRSPSLSGLVAARQVRYEQATYGFNQLREIRDFLYSHGHLRRVAFTDLDEVENRVRVGDREGNAAEELRQALRAHAIPVGSVVIEVQWGEPAARLRDRFRPVPGGVQIERASDSAGCSVGVSVEASVLGPGFITASHCSDRTFSQGGASLFQNTVSPANEVSWEASDPIWYSPGPPPCGSTYVGCRYSDAAFMAYLGSYGLKGAIARTTGIGSSTVDPNNPPS